MWQQDIDKIRTLVLRNPLEVGVQMEMEKKERQLNTRIKEIV